MFNKEILKIIPKLSLLPFLIWSTVLNEKRGKKDSVLNHTKINVVSTLVKAGSL